MSKSKEVLNVYTTLDTLLDTRLPVLTVMAPKIAQKVVNNMYYYSRVMDEFESIPYNMFRPLYENRSKAVLNLATPTYILETIKNYVNEAIHAAKERGESGEVNLYVNSYPYKLTEVEITNLIIGITNMLPNVNVTIIDRSPIELTPEWVDKNIAVMFDYEGLSWIELHNSLGHLIKNPLVEIALFVPALVTRTIDTINFEKKLKEVEEMFKPIIRLTFHPTIGFCSAIK